MFGILYPSDDHICSCSSKNYSLLLFLRRDRSQTPLIPSILHSRFNNAAAISQIMRLVKVSGGWMVGEEMNCSTGTVCTPEFVFKAIHRMLQYIFT